MKTKSNGDHARIGLFVALTAMMGQVYARDFFEKRRKNGHSRSGDTRRHDHDSPAGFKLIKKMHRQPAKTGKDPEVFSRKNRKHVERLAIAQDKAFLDRRVSRLRYARA